MSTVEIPHAEEAVLTPVPVTGAVCITGRVPTSEEAADFGAYRTIVLVGTEDKQLVLPYDKHRVRALITCTGTGPSTSTVQNLTTGAAPAAAADWTVTVPAGHTWALQSIQATLVTSATVATRQVMLVIDNGTTDIWRINLPVTQAASLTYEYVFGGFTNDAAVRTVGASSEVLSELPALSLGAGYRIRSVTSGIAAGDQWSAQLVNYLDSTTTTGAQVYIGTEAQCAAVKQGNTAAGGYVLTAGQSLPVAHKQSVWMVPDQVHAATVSIVQERMQS